MIATVGLNFGATIVAVLAVLGVVSIARAAVDVRRDRLSRDRVGAEALDLREALSYAYTIALDAVHRLEEHEPVSAQDVRARLTFLAGRHPWLTWHEGASSSDDR